MAPAQAEVVSAFLLFFGVGSREARLAPINGWQDKRLTTYT